MPFSGWTVTILPFIEQGPLAGQAVAAYRANPNPFAAPPHPSLDTPARGFACPTDHYLLVNRSDKPVDEWVTPATPARSAAILDPRAADRVGVASLRRGGDGRPQVRLQLDPGESCVLRTFTATEVNGPPWRYWRPAGEAVTLSGTWAVEFVEGGPTLPARFEACDPGSWAARPDAAAFAGTARYTLALTARPATPGTGGSTSPGMRDGSGDRERQAGRDAVPGGGRQASEAGPQRADY